MTHDFTTFGWSVKSMRLSFADEDTIYLMSAEGTPLPARQVDACAAKEVGVTRLNTRTSIRSDFVILSRGPR